MKNFNWFDELGMMFGVCVMIFAPLEAKWTGLAILLISGFRYLKD